MSSWLEEDNARLRSQLHRCRTQLSDIGAEQAQWHIMFQSMAAPNVMFRLSLTSPHLTIEALEHIEAHLAVYKSVITRRDSERNNAGVEQAVERLAELPVNA